MRDLVRSARVFLYGDFIGLLREDKYGFHFAYNPDYRGIPLSLSLPVEKSPFHSDILFPYFASLIPEGWLKKKYATYQQIDEHDLFRFLMNNGENMLGAVQIRRES
ncbi:type II toxin-antitoxin system HipA family toxin [Aggregatibacter segnis]|jgi:uncharacterized protein HI_0666|uniref:HipA N-terminal domain-containing protein n=1 Tax=Aggregatibacter segnis TaxID=739 RepID=UPI000DAB6FE9|nr:HipA N-terminal domain-containing protein [Aggregatibacter segnis]RDE66274.1 type II toxin-antitoxin system HipA family toxin [Aggregatibacter segnis]